MGHSVAMMMSNNTMSNLETRAIVHLEVHNYDIAVNQVWHVYVRMSI